jgi:23S rRNA (adenine-N6)-dimethyltransferase
MSELWESCSQGGSAMHNLQRKLLSQNFLHSRKLVNKLVGSSSIGKNDLVLEIGSGQGIITEQLAQKAGSVIAVELDTHWYKYLKSKFSSANKIILYHEDFLNMPLPRHPYKVFANIPFAIEGKIIRKLIDDSNPPRDCYLVMMKELAYRLAAPYKENQFSIMHKPWFDFSIYHHFNRTDFSPIPSVEAVMFRFTLKKTTLLPLSEKKKYEQFVIRGFGQGLPIRQNLKKYYSKNMLRKIFQTYSLDKDIKPSYVTLEQWITLYSNLGGTN